MKKIGKTERNILEVFLKYPNKIYRTEDDIRRKIHRRSHIYKELNILVNKGYLRKHKTKNKNEFQITNEGLALIRKPKYNKHNINAWDSFDKDGKYFKDIYGKSLTKDSGLEKKAHICGYKQGNNYMYDITIKVKETDEEVWLGYSTFNLESEQNIDKDVFDTTRDALEQI